MKKTLFMIFIFISCLYSKQNSLGLGVINSSSIYLNENDKRTIIPVINYSYKKIYIKALRLGLKYNNNISIIAQPRLSEIKIPGTQTKKRTIEAGFELSKNIKKYKLRFKTLFDTLGRHNGYHSSLKLSQTIVKVPFIFIPNIGLEYKDSNFSNYYYESKSSIHKTIGFVSILNVSKKHAFNLIYNYKKFDKDINKSPIIKKDTQQTAIFSFVYKF